MPVVSSFEIIERADRPILSVRGIAAMENISRIIGEGYAKIGAYLASAGTYPSDAPFVAYHNMDMQALDIEMCFPVAKPLPGNAEVKAGTIAAGKFVYGMYRGSYEDIGPAYEEMTKWMQEKGLKDNGVFHECYLNGPEGPPEEYLTMMLIGIQ